ncbi:MAG: HalD/BesD family halogenase [Acidimicrobiales bacterium]
MDSDTSLVDLVDLDRYPLGVLDGAVGGALVAGARAQLAQMGAAELPGFVGPAGVDRLVEDAESLATRAHHSGGEGTAYLEFPDFNLPPEHPRLRFAPYGVGAVGYDIVPRSSPLRRVYESEAVLAMIGRILDRGPLYRYGDPFGALNLSVMAAGDELQWHFDQTDFVVSLAIQSAEAGGDFEVVPRIRRSGDENYPGVARVLDGTAAEGDPPVVTLAMTPGTLLIFEGRNSLHRVSPIAGSRLRHVGLLAYDTAPGTMGSDLLRMDRYGRTEPFAEPPDRWPAA